MISPALSKLAAWRKWIFLAAAAWTFVLLLVARGTAKLQEPHPRPVAAQSNAAPNKPNLQTALFQQENDRLRAELRSLPELRARSERLRNEIASREKKDQAVWAAQSNALTTAIESEQRELGELRRWSSEWHLAEQRKAALARLAEKAQEGSLPIDQEYAVAEQTFRQLALANKRLVEIRYEWRQLANTEKEKFGSRLQEAQAEWWTVWEKLGKDQVLYQVFPITNPTQDASTVLFMRSIVPDANRMITSVYLDGTVTFSEAINP